MKNLLQQVSIELELRPSSTCWIVGGSEASNPVQVTARPPCEKLCDTPGEAEVLSLLTRSGSALESSPPGELELAESESVGVEINLSLTQS